MHFKFDENLDPRWRAPLVESGHTVSTVPEEKLRGETDATIAAICRSLGMGFLTLDMGFAQATTYPPADYAGLIVLRHPRPTLAAMLGLVQQVATLLQRESPQGCLWMVEPGRVRIRTAHAE